MERSAVRSSLVQDPYHCCCHGQRYGFLSLGRMRQPHRMQRSSRLRVRAADESNEASKVDVKKLGIIPFETDNETFQDVMAFAGTAPERTNGRIAMIAFAGAAAAEVATKKSILEQAAERPVFITFMVFLLTVAGFMPKLASGVSLSKLIDAAGKEGLPKELAFFNKTHEIWLGRVAMLGFTGLLGIEIWKGGAFF